MFDFSGSKNLLVFVLEEWKLLLFFTVIFGLYFHYTSTFSFFENKGVKFMKPTILLGNLWPRISLKMSFHDFHLHIYNYFKGEPYGGVFEGRRPVLHVFDPDLIKAVTIRDFDHFVDRNTLGSREPKYLSQSLLNLKGLEWKGVRSTLTPSFSSSRLRNMLPLIQVCSDQMVQFLKQYVVGVFIHKATYMWTLYGFSSSGIEDKKDVEMKDIMGHFTLEVIGACAFGIKCEALADENAHFVKVAEKFNYMSKSKRFLIFFVLIFMPKMFSILNISFMNPETTKELIRMLTATKAERRSSETKRNDFLQLMIDAADKEKIETDSENERYLDDDTIDAQSLLFLIAGYETSSTLLSFAIHVLATRPELQDKLRSHVEQQTRGRDITYEVLAEMTYLDGFLLETLRIYPPVSRVDRVCTKPYTLPGTPVHLSPGDVVGIPIYGIHMDPNIYPEPEQFRPERFMDEEKKNRPAHLFLAFGVGPRNCIGLRFAMLSAKLAMVTLLKNFKFSACPKTVDPVNFDKRGILLKAADGLWVNIEATS